MSTSSRLFTDSLTHAIDGDYNLLPNDALILATCKLHRISRIAGYDADFATACASEGIQLIQQVTDLTV